ncbi:MAG: class II aldolase/adducin family protein [Terriglobales bacterium]
MTKLDSYIDDLVVANRILAAEGIVDAFGHISVRHPDRPDRYFLSRSRAPQCVEHDDIMEFSLEGEPIDARGRAPYFERFIHGAIYQSWPEARSVIHSHSQAVIPFSVGNETIRPLMQNCASIGHSVPVWDSRTKFGDTDLMVTSMEMARDLAQTIGRNPTVLMRGHGSVAVGPSIRRAVFNGIKLQESANFQKEVARFKKVIYLSAGEVEKCQLLLDTADRKPLGGIDRAWEYWCSRAGMTFKPRAD